MTYAVFLLFAVALMFASGDAEANWEQQGDYPSAADSPIDLVYHSGSDRLIMLDENGEDVSLSPHQERMFPRGRGA